jgi:hypothetical protein
MRLIVDIANIKENQVQQAMEYIATNLDKEYNTPVTINCIDKTNSNQFCENDNIEALRKAHIENEIK